MDEQVEVPYLKYVYYDQGRSQELGLNHTLSIIMNYFSFVLPLWGDSIEIKGRKFYWMSKNELLRDMPTLSISMSTLKTHINKLIKDGLLEREIVKEKDKLPRSFFRATNKYTQGDITTRANFATVLNEMDILLREGRINSTEKEKISKLLSSYSGKSKKNSTTYNLDDVHGTKILDYLKREFELSEKGEGVIMNVGCEVNKEWIIENMINPILNKGELHGWIPFNQGGKLDVNDDVKRLILSKLHTMFQWLKDNKAEVKSMKGRINTFFGTKKI